MRFTDRMQMEPISVGLVTGGVAACVFSIEGFFRSSGGHKEKLNQGDDLRARVFVVCVSQFVRGVSFCSAGLMTSNGL